MTVCDNDGNTLFYKFDSTNISSADVFEFKWEAYDTKREIYVLDIAMLRYKKQCIRICTDSDKSLYVLYEEIPDSGGRNILGEGKTSQEIDGLIRQRCLEMLPKLRDTYKMFLLEINKELANLKMRTLPNG